jgi:phosphatidylglycerophosphate synthase
MNVSPLLVTSATPSVPSCARSNRSGEGAHRAARHPLSRWHLQPLADLLAGALAATRLRPLHVTLAGACLWFAAALALVARPEGSWLAAGLVLAAWFCDRLDGPLARRQGTASRRGAWLDANLDELADVGLHAAVAWAASTATASHVPWLWLSALVAGKYLFMYGLSTEQPPTGAAADTAPLAADKRQRWSHALRGLYHLPANADLRVHALALAAGTGWLTAELAAVAVYYHLRWLARYPLVWRRLAEAPR